MGRTLVAESILVVVKNANRRRVEIVELASAHRPDERPDRGYRQDDGRRQENVDHAHCLSSKVDAVKASARTVNELIGIKIAATNGPISPAIANDAAIALYASENPRLR